MWRPTRTAPAPAIAVVVSLLLVLSADATIRASLEKLREYRLAVRAEADLARLERTVASLRSSAQEAEIVAAAAKVLPTLQQLEDIAWQFGLQTRRVEKQATANIGGATPGVTVSYLGTVFEVIPFLAHAEERYCLDIEQALLQKADAIGERVVLTVNLKVAEP